MTLNQARERLEALQKKQCALEHAVSLLQYDGATTAPRGTAANRAQTIALLGEELYRLTTGAEAGEVLDCLDANADQLTDRERRIAQLWGKNIREMRCIPLEEYVTFRKVMVQANAVWQEAKAKSDFALYEPILEQVFDYHKKIARWAAPDRAPYDYWLDKFEEGLTMERCEAFFSALRERIVPLLRRVQAKPQLPDDILRGEFPAADQEKLSWKLLELLRLDLDHVGLSTTEHPFTTWLGSHHDVRVTTHYYEDNFSRSLFSVVHEGGHALYETGSADDLAYSVLDGGVSMGIHESQSRFYENILGRSRAFCEYIFPVCAQIFPRQLQGYGAEDLYRAVNRAQPGLIRIEADELTYALHVMVRYQLEKALFAGEVSVHDLPGEWNRLYKEYLGIDVPDDRRGVLQDSHWSNGHIGYFPSYALGSAYGAQYLRKMEETVDVEGCLRKGDLAPINAWLRERIWQFGHLRTPMETFRHAVGEDFDPTVFTDYLERKYTELYHL